MLRMQSAVTVLAALCMLLAACFMSDQALFSAADAVTPFPEDFLLASITQFGEIKREGSGPVTPAQYRRAGNQYALVPQTMLLTIVDIGIAPLYLVQAEVGDDKSKHSFQYALLKQLDDTLIVYAPVANKLKAALQNASIGFVDETADFKFADRAQLVAAMRIFATRLEDGASLRLRIASSPEQKRSLLAQIAAVNSAAPPVPAQQPRPAPPPQASAAQDPGASSPNGCDQQAAHPRDPNRIAQGVPLQSIVPMLARQECQRAVEQFPNTPRFVYQLARADEASGNKTAAFAEYQKAAGMGYPMAFFGLGIAYEYGTGVAPDYAMAGQYLKKAIASGIDAEAELHGVIFDPTGFSNPTFFLAMFQGQVTGADAKAAAVYLGEFMQMFHNTPDCQNVVTTAALGRLLMQEQFGGFGMMLQGLMNAHRQPSNGDYGRDFKQGMDAAMDANNNLLTSVSNARTDAQLFYDREGCHSPVAVQFFHNVEALAARL